MGQPVTVSLGIGTDRANRKPVLGVFDRSGRPIAFAKVGDSPVAGGHVRDEARALALVNEQDWSVVTTPELLAHRTWRGMEVMVMSALRPPAWRGRGVWPIPDDAADEVSRLFSSGRSTLVDSPMWRRCEDSVLAVGDDAIREVLVSAMSTVLDAAGDRQLDLGGFHGDFTPWNLARVGERTLLWDWERFETGVPRGFDRLHYAVNASLRAGGLKPESVLSGLGRAGAGSENESDQVLGAAYLVSVSCRYLTATAGSGEAAFVPRAAAVLAALSSHCDRLGPERRESAS